MYWQLNTDPYFGSASHHLTDWFSHDTKIGPRWGEGRASFKTAGEWRIYENARQMMAAGTDPVRVVIEHGHRAGLDVFLSLRFNDGHDHRVVWAIVNVEEWDPEQTMPRTVLTPPAGGSPSPDIPNWAWHEYGNRVGFWRMLEVLHATFG